ncbi:MAG: class I SAM-dependent methyltransferase [Oscillospiraceae bacterium]|nr:class I SAM-dependent methyltransferase [Oscillospiraceae bacterium]
MVESKGWKWEIVDDDESGIWKSPCVESYYLLDRWKQQNKMQFLDLGSGLGRHSIQFGKNGFSVHCFDISEEAILRTKEWAKNEGLSFKYAIGDMLKLPYADGSLDCILCRNVISHTDTNGVKQAVSEIYRVLCKGGECYLTLCSKATSEFSKKERPSVDENTRLRMDDGPEYKVPHFYADYGLIKELFAEFKIISIAHIEDFWEKGGETNSSFHYHILVKKDG